MRPPATDPATRWTAGLWGLLLVLSGNMLIDALEVSVAVVALPSIGTQLGVPISALHATISGFALGFGGFLLVGRRVVERIGRRRVYLAALLVFAAASVAGALAGDMYLLVATRFVKGFCVALTAPTGLAIISGTFAAGPDRTRAISVYSTMGASGFSVGLVLSGLLTGISWRWALLFPAPVAVALFVAGVWLIPPDAPVVAASRRYDVAGGLALIGAAVLLLYGITSGAGTGWATPLTIGALLLAAVSLTAFVLVQRGTADPLVHLGGLARGPLARSVLGAVTLNGSYWGFLYVVTLHLQGPAGWTPLQTGLAILPASLLPTLVAPFAARLVGAVGAPRLIAMGAAAPPVGYALYLGAGARPDYVTGVLPVMVLVGLGFALGFSSLHVQAMTGATPDEAGPVSAAYQTAVQIGGAVVLAGTAAVLVAGQRPALLVVTAIGAGGLLVALTALWPVPRIPIHRPPEGGRRRHEHTR